MSDAVVKIKVRHVVRTDPPIEAKDVEPFLERVNATEFQGRAAGTLLLTGFNRTRGVNTFRMSYRPTGWGEWFVPVEFRAIPGLDAPDAEEMS